MAIFSNTGFYGFLMSCKKEAGEYVEWFRSGIKGYGWRMGTSPGDTSESPEYTLEIDTVQVRDQIRSVEYDGDVSAMSRKGFVVETNYTPPGEQEITGYSRAEFDEMLVRKRSVFKEIMIEQLNSVAGGMVISAAHAKIAAVRSVQDGWYIVLNEEVSGNAPFYKGDMVRCERMYPTPDGEGVKQKKYWRLVKEAGDTATLNATLYPDLCQAGKRYLLLSRTECENGSGEPEKEDAILQFGHIGVSGLSDPSLTTQDRENRRRAVRLSPVNHERAAFLEYRGLGTLPKGTNPVDTAAYFVCDPDYHESISICGKGSNQFTGELRITSSGSTGTVDPFEYLVQIGQMNGTLQKMRELEDDIFAQSMKTQSGKSVLKAKLRFLQQTEQEMEQEDYRVTKNEIITGKRVLLCAGNYEVNLAKAKAQSAYSQFKETSGKALVALAQLSEGIKIYTGILPPSGTGTSWDATRVEEAFQRFLNLYKEYVNAHTAFWNAIEACIQLDHREYASELKVDTDKILLNVTEKSGVFYKSWSEIQLEDSRVLLQSVEENAMEEKMGYARAGIEIVADPQPHIELQAEKIRFKSGNRLTGETLMEYTPGQMVYAARNEYKKSGLELTAGKGGTESSVSLYAEQVDIVTSRLETKSFLHFSEAYFMAAIQDPYKTVGLEISAEGEKSCITLQADQTEIQTGSETASLFIEGKLNADLVNTDNLIVQGSLAEIPRPIEFTNPVTPGTIPEITLDFEKGFNFSGHYESDQVKEVALILPTDKKYDGVRSTLINTGSAENSCTFVVKFPYQDEEPSKWASHRCSFHTNRNLVQTDKELTGKDPRIIEVHVAPGGILRLYAFLSQYNEEDLGQDVTELFWFIENITDYYSFRITTDKLGLQYYNQGIKLVPVAVLGLYFSFSYNQTRDFESNGKDTLLQVFKSRNWEYKDLMTGNGIPNGYLLTLTLTLRDEYGAKDRYTFARASRMGSAYDALLYYVDAVVEGDDVVVSILATEEYKNTNPTQQPAFKLEIYQHGF